MSVTHLQQANNPNTGGIGRYTSWSCTFNNATSAGSFLLAVWYGLSDYGIYPPQTVNDTGGNTYTLAVVNGWLDSNPYGPKGFGTYIFTCANAKPNAGTVTMTDLPSGDWWVNMGIFLHEYSGVSGLDVTSSSNTIIPTVAGDLIYQIADTSALPTGFAALQSQILSAPYGSGNGVYYESHFLSGASGSTALTKIHWNAAVACKPTMVRLLGSTGCGV